MSRPPLPGMTPALARLTNVSKLHRRTRGIYSAVSAVNLTVEAGDFVAITGPSGCGKSTLLAILGLLDEPTTGTYDFRGTAVTTLAFRERTTLRNRDIGFVFQSCNLIPSLSLVENVELPLAYRAVPPALRRPAAWQALARVGLGLKGHLLPAQLSGGEQQRAALARALAGDPTLLVADEPTGNLDTLSGQQVMGLLARLNRDGVTIVVATHDEQVARHARRTIRMLDGRLLPH